MRSPPTVTRRSVLVAGALGGAALTVGFPLTTAAGTARSGRRGEVFQPNAWLRISPDNRVTALIAPSEMGQGIFTALAMVLADELDADWSTVAVEAAPADPVYGNPLFHGLRATNASVSVISYYDTTRQAAAAARMMLVAAAAAEWGVPAAACHTADSTVRGPSGQRRSYGELVTAAARLEPPVKSTLRLKSREELTLVGRSMPRIEGPLKVVGAPIYGLDVELPGMLTAMVARAPVSGARAKKYDRGAALGVAGVRLVVEVPSGVAVIAENYWAALRGRERLQVQWDFGASELSSSAQLEERYRALAAAQGPVAASQGDTYGALRDAQDPIRAEYVVPYLAHAPMEPLNCTIQATSSRCDVWAGTQYQSLDQQVVASILDLPRSQVYIHTAYLGGSFGRRGSPTEDVVAETAQIVKATRALAVPIKNVWSREDDIRGGFYRPMALNTLAATLDESGMPRAWLHRIVAQSVVGHSEFNFFVTGGIDAANVAGARDLPYAVPNLRVELHTPELGPTVQWMRSVGNSNTCFAVESFLDELAHHARLDPVELRRKLLAGKKGSERLLNVLNVVAEKSGWGRPLPAGTARGIAVHDYWGTKVGQVAEVSVVDGQVRVLRVTCVIDCGMIVNPDGVKAQMEGGIQFALSAVLYGEITFTEGRCDQTNFDTYPVLRLNACPDIDVHLIDSQEPPGGVGETAVPNVGPAVCNAIFAASGRRIRRLPLSRSGLKV